MATARLSISLSIAASSTSAPTARAAESATSRSTPRRTNSACSWRADLADWRDTTQRSASPWSSINPVSSNRQVMDSESSSGTPRWRRCASSSLRVRALRSRNRRASSRAADSETLGCLGNDSSVRNDGGLCRRSRIGAAARCRGGSHPADVGRPQRHRFPPCAVPPCAIAPCAIAPCAPAPSGCLSCRQKSTGTTGARSSASRTGPIPSFSLTRFSTSSAISGLSRRKARAFSRPWPSCSDS